MTGKLFIRACSENSPKSVGIGQHIYSCASNAINELIIANCFSILKQLAIISTEEKNCRSDVMCSTKSEQELHHCEERAARKLIDAFRKCQLIIVCIANYL